MRATGHPDRRPYGRPVVRAWELECLEDAELDAEEAERLEDTELVAEEAERLGDADWTRRTRSAWRT